LHDARRAAVETTRAAMRVGCSQLAPAAGHGAARGCAGGRVAAPATGVTAPT